MTPALLRIARWTCLLAAACVSAALFAPETQAAPNVKRSVKATTAKGKIKQAYAKIQPRRIAAKTAKKPVRKPVLAARHPPTTKVAAGRTHKIVARKPFALAAAPRPRTATLVKTNKAIVPLPRKPVRAIPQRPLQYTRYLPDKGIGRLTASFVVENNTDIEDPMPPIRIKVDSQQVARTFCTSEGRIYLATDCD